jgi:hypothetical protein
MGVYKFSEDIKTGKLGEYIVGLHLINKGFMGNYVEIVNYNNNNSYDIETIINGTKKFFEVKTDEFCNTNRNRNIFIEFESRNKSSGIVVSQSDYFLTFFIHLNELWSIDTNKLRELINNNNFPVGIGGDKGSNTKGYLIQKEFFHHHFNITKIF